MSYAALTLLAVVILILSSFLVRKIVYEQTLKANGVVLNQVGKVMDEMILEIEKMVDTVRINKAVITAARCKGMPNASQRYAFSELSKELRTLTALSNRYEKYYLFFPNEDMIVLPSGIMSSRTYYMAFDLSNKISYPDWIDLISRDSNNHFMSVGTDSPILTYINRSSLGFSDTANDLSIIIEILPATLFSPASDVDALENTLLQILHKDGFVISTHTGDVPAIEYGLLTERQGVFNLTDQSGRYAVSYTSSQYWELKYVSITPYQAIQSKLAGTVRVFTGGVLLMILISAALITFFVKKNYDPVGNLVTMLRAHNPESSGRMQNEFHFISETLSSIIDEKEHIAHNLSSQKAYAKDALMTKLLLDEWSDTMPMADLLESCGISFPSDFFAVINMIVVYEDSVLHTDARENENDWLKLMHFVVRNVAEEIASREGKGYILEMQGCFSLILSFNPQTDMEEGRSQLISIKAEIEQFMLSQFNVNLRIAASMPRRGLMGIGAAYKEASRVLAYKLMMDDRDSVFMDDVKEPAKPSDYFYPLEMEHLLLNSLKNGEDEKAQDILTQLFEKNMKQGAASQLNLRCLMFDLVGTVLKANSENDSRGYMSTGDPIQKLTDCTSLQEMMLTVRSLYQDACVCSKEKNSFDNSLKTRAEQYIQENYHNSELSLGHIADALGFHPTYLSFAFKEQVKTGIVDYLNRIRVEKAVQLFKDADLSINEIALRVGCVNPKTFTRLYKKYTGITPSQYRDLLREQKQEKGE